VSKMLKLLAHISKYLPLFKALRRPLPRAMAKPTLVFVPGIWEGPSIFDIVRDSLRAYGYNSVYAPLASTGKASPGNPTLLDDVQHIRNVIKPLVEEDKEVVVVGHSAGGPLGAAATKGLSVKERTEAGQAGGVKKFVFMTAGLVPAGWRHPDVLDVYDIQGGEHHCKDPMNLLFNDLPPNVAESWLAKFQRQPATGWADVVEHAGWKDAPSVYLICENDQAMSVGLQEKVSAMAGCEIERCGSGHMVTLTMPEKVVEMIRRAAGEVI